MLRLFLYSPSTALTPTHTHSHNNRTKTLQPTSKAQHSYQTSSSTSSKHSRPVNLQNQIFKMDRYGASSRGYSNSGDYDDYSSRRTGDSSRRTGDTSRRIGDSSRRIGGVSGGSHRRETSIRHTIYSSDEDSEPRHRRTTRGSEHNFGSPYNLSDTQVTGIAMAELLAEGYPAPINHGSYHRCHDCSNGATGLLIHVSIHRCHHCLAEEEDDVAPLRSHTGQSSRRAIAPPMSSRSSRTPSMSSSRTSRAPSTSSRSSHTPSMSSSRISRAPSTSSSHTSHAPSISSFRSSLRASGRHDDDSNGYQQALTTRDHRFSTHGTSSRDAPASAADSSRARSGRPSRRDSESRSSRYY